MNRRAFLGTAAIAVGAISVARGAVSPPGKTFLPSLPTAPFPHPSRANGHEYNGTLYRAAGHYSDSTVGIYVPSYFRPGEATDLVVHFHGWNNHVTEVFRRYRLREQLEESGRNAVLVVPQGPKDAPDSGDGKLELDDDGFARFVASVAAYLRSSGIVSATGVGSIVLSSHSGGYGGLGGVLTRGGMNAQITDVLLFDSAYGYFDAMAGWTKSDPHNHLLSIFTDDTSLGNTELMALLQGNRPYQVLDADVMAPASLATREPTFIVTHGVAHDDLLQHDDWYAEFLRTTALTVL
jgi:hypothetical protein